MSGVVRMHLAEIYDPDSQSWSIKYDPVTNPAVVYCVGVHAIVLLLLVCLVMEEVAKVLWVHSHYILGHCSCRLACSNSWSE